jgi:cytochrome P450
MFDLFSDEMRRDPYPVYEMLRQGAPVFHLAAFDLWMIFDYDGVKRALVDHDVFSSNLAQVPGNGNPGEWFIFFDPPRHTKLRALIAKAFTPRVVANLEPRIRELSRQLLDETIERGAMDLAVDFAVPLPMRVIAELLGIPAAEWPRYKCWSDTILKIANTFAKNDETVKTFEEFRAVREEMRAFLPKLIAQRQAAHQEDLLTRLVEAEVDGERLTHEEILGFVQLLLVGGQETTANLINNAVLCFLENPDQLAQLRATPDLLPSAIEEVLRYRSPLHWMPRATTRPIEMHGQTIPAGKLVLPMIGSANRDPRQFRDAGRFDIARDPNPHLAFGQGIHVCLGAPLARLEARIALTDFLERVQDFALASPEPWEPRKALSVHGPSRLPIRFKPGRRVGATE